MVYCGSLSRLEPGSLDSLLGYISMSRLSYREGKRLSMILNGVGTLVVFFVLTISLLWVYPLVSLSVSLLIALGFYRLWIKSGRPRGVSKAAARAVTGE
jgi:Flp pilus assembly protein TadB